MPTIPITEYQLPDGHKCHTTMEVEPAIEDLFNRFKMKASAEILRTGEIVVYITLPDWDAMDVLLEICNNGSSTGRLLSPVEGMLKLIREAAELESSNTHGFKGGTH